MSPRDIHWPAHWTAFSCTQGQGSTCVKAHPAKPREGGLYLLIPVISDTRTSFQTPFSDPFYAVSGVDMEAKLSVCTMGRTRACVI